MKWTHSAALLTCLWAFQIGLLKTWAEPPAREVSLTIINEAVVDMSPYRLNPWGFYQFPMVVKGDDGAIYATFSTRPDSVRSHGGTSPVFRYDLAANTWTRVNKPATSLPKGIILPNGDRLVSKSVLGAEAKELKLPKKVFVAKNWRKVPFYDARDIAQFQPQWWFFARKTHDAGDWITETPVVHIPRETRQVREGLLMYPAFLQMLVGPALPGTPPVNTPTPIYGVNMDRRFLDADCTNLQSHHSILIYESLDNGHVWNLVGEIPYQPDPTADKQLERRMGFSEPWLNFMPDGSLICFIRSTFNSVNGPMYLARSADRGRTWNKPVVFDDHGVKPKTLTLNNGVTIVSYGRPGVSIAVTRDAAGLQWQKPLPIVPPGEEWLSESCGYTSLLALGDHEFMLAYSDFNRKDAHGERCKAIVTKRIIAQ